MIAVAITGIGACYYNSYPAFKTLTFMLKGGDTNIKYIQIVGNLTGYNTKVSHFIKDTTMNAIKSVLSGNSSNLPEWLFNIVKHICEHPHESCEQQIVESLRNQFGKVEGGKARGRKKMKSKKKMYNRKTKRRTQRK